MFNKIAMSVLLAAAFAAPAAAHDLRRSPAPLLGALVSLGNHGSIANVAANVDTRSGLHSSLADVNVNALNGAVRANVAVGRSGRHSSTLLGIGATVLDGGVGHRGGW
jgi:hypothetical protein